MIAFVEAKRPDYEQIRELLARSEASGVWSNFGPVSLQLEETVAEILALPRGRRVVACANGTVALHGWCTLYEHLAGRPLRWVVSAFTFHAQAAGTPRRRASPRLRCAGVPRSRCARRPARRVVRRDRGDQPVRDGALTSNATRNWRRAPARSSSSTRPPASARRTTASPSVASVPARSSASITPSPAASARAGVRWCPPSSKTRSGR